MRSFLSPARVRIPIKGCVGRPPGRRSLAILAALWSFLGHPVASIAVSRRRKKKKNSSLRDFWSERSP